MKTIYICLFAIFLSVSAYAQNVQFKVLASQGENKVRHKGETKNLYTGKEVFSGDKIIIEKDGYAGLIHNNGTTLEIKQAGTFDTDELSSKVKNKSSNASEKYSKFVMNQLTEKEKDIEGNHRKYMKVAGAVTRGLNDNEIEVCLPAEKSYLVPGNNILTWRKNPEVETYQVIFTDMFEKKVYSASTKDTAFRFNTKDIAVPDDNMLIVHVKAKNGNIKSQKHALEVIDDHNNSMVLKQENELNKDLENETAINYLIKAAFYEEQNVFLKANECYSKAVQLAPEVGPYKVAYLDFLKKHNKNSFFRDPVATAE